MISILKKVLPKSVKRKLKELTKKIRRLIKPDPKSYKDIVGSYEKYIYYQTEKYISFESTNLRWSEGQRRYIEIEFSNYQRDIFILDIACGEGVGLKVFKEMGFKNVIGVELSDKKIEKAKEIGYKVIKADMHKLNIFDNDYFDIIYSSHTLEHAYKPGTVIEEFYRILKKEGLLKIVLPYPDISRDNEEKHGGKYELGTNLEDEGDTVIKYFKKYGFSIVEKKFDDFREPEIWLTFKK